MIIDCHGHYTTAPGQLQVFRDAQLAAFKAGGGAPAAAHISDDEIRASLEGAQLKLQRVDQRGAGRDGDLGGGALGAADGQRDVGAGRVVERAQDAAGAVRLRGDNQHVAQLQAAKIGPDAVRRRVDRRGALCVDGTATGERHGANANGGDHAQALCSFGSANAGSDSHVSNSSWKRSKISPHSLSAKAANVRFPPRWRALVTPKRRLREAGDCTKRSFSQGWGDCPIVGTIAR